MADTVEYFINGDTYTTDGPHYSIPKSTRDLRDYSFYLLVDTLAGGGTDTMDIDIQESDDEEFATAYKIRTLASFTQVLGNSTSPSLVKQKLNPSDNNINRWVRTKVTFGSGDASVFSTKFAVLWGVNEKV